MLGAQRNEDYFGMSLAASVAASCKAPSGSMFYMLWPQSRKGEAQTKFCMLHLSPLKKGVTV